MPVATILAIAASFWGSHGYTPTQPITWSWNTTPAYQMAGVQAYAPMLGQQGLRHIVLVRIWWNSATNQDRCVVLIHEMGHAAFGFTHTPRGIMAAYDEDRPVPGTCKRSKAAWRTAARRSS